MADRQAMLRQINEASFALNELTLYLDTHPADDRALAEFQKRRSERKALMEAYAEEYEPLTVDCICRETGGCPQCGDKYAGEKHFTWVDGPLPWEGGTL